MIPARRRPSQAPSTIPGCQSDDQIPAHCAATIVCVGRGGTRPDDGGKRGPDGEVRDPLRPHPDLRKQQDQRRHDDHAAADPEEAGEQPGRGADAR
jgi:hypothetical protein